MQTVENHQPYQVQSLEPTRGGRKGKCSREIVTGKYIVHLSFAAETSLPQSTGSSGPTAQLWFRATEFMEIGGGFFHCNSLQSVETPIQSLECVSERTPPSALRMNRRINLPVVSSSCQIFEWIWKSPTLKQR